MNPNLRKRRAYCPEQSPAVPVLQDFPPDPHRFSPAAGCFGQTPPLPQQLNQRNLPVNNLHQYILRQAPNVEVTITVSLYDLLNLHRPEQRQLLLEKAAPSLEVPVGTLLELTKLQSHSHKRPRLDPPPLAMSTPYTDDPSGHEEGQEKPPPSGRSNHDPNNESRRPFTAFAAEPGCFPSGWSSGPLASCLQDYLCQPFSSFIGPSEYSPLPPTTQHEYGGVRPAMVDGVASFQPTTTVSMSSTSVPSDPISLFAGGGGPEVGDSFLASYPPLQPTPLTGAQPLATREEMIYPTTSPIANYDGLPDSSRAAGTGAGVRPPQLHLMSPTATSLMSNSYPAELDPSVYGRSGSIPGIHQGYMGEQAFGAKNDAMRYEMQQRPTAFDMFPHSRTISARRGPFKNHDQREQTAHTRKIGSCIRCRMQRIRCNLDPEDEKGPCLGCKKIAANTTKIYRLNCLRWKIMDVKLFKPGQVKDHKWTERWKDSVVDDIGNWASSEVKTIRVTEGYTGKWIELQVRQFEPQPGDSLYRKWVSKNGEVKKARVPAFAIVDMESAKSSFDEYIKRALGSCCTYLLRKQKLLQRTYFLALKVMQDPSTHETERRLIKSTLDLWMSVRLTTKSFEIVGEERLGMPQDIIDDPDSPLCGKIPLPPVMGAQIDSILIHQVQPQLRRDTLEELQKMTQEKKQRTWLTTYLVTFILLHNIALITRHDADYAKKHNMGRRFAREDSVREYNIGANTLLAYFHYCNRAIYPFSAECKDPDLQSLAELDDDAMRFVRETRQLVAEQKSDWERVLAREEYEDQYYYVSQLFEPNWQPRVMA
ncbi:hypothetical protein QBC45DRAFT_450065 [Copromyces sp. CBS 386.78]|nr:hypothetical protein QBC45DRAFT_450065 [Copromyces sp. CBS 386.78]